jgi:hypothetical protein
MAAIFVAGESTAVQQLGFDDTAVPPWIMVPMQGKRLVVLKDGRGLSLGLRMGRPGIINFQEQPHPQGRGILLTAVNPGTVILEAKDPGGGVRAALEITVKQRRTLTTCYVGISDNSGRMSTTGMASATHMLEVANKLYLPQANIELLHHASKGVALTFDMPTGMPTIFPPFAAPRSWDRNTPGPLACISSRPPGVFGRGGNIPLCLLEERIIAPLRSADDLDAIRRTQMLINIVVHVDPGSDYNIFFVRALDQHGGAGGLVGFTKGFTPLALNGIAINAVFIQDSAATGHVLAHELGHFLLSPNPGFMPPDGHSRGTNDLMRSTQGPTDIKIPKEQANFMNASGFP